MALLPILPYGLCLTLQPVRTSDTTIGEMPGSDKHQTISFSSNGRQNFLVPIPDPHYYNKMESLSGTY